MKSRLAWLLPALAGVAAAGNVAAQDAPASPPRSAPVKDREFGVETRRFGLERRVEMYQWRKYGPGYGKVWSETRIDSTHYAPAYRNPEMPLQSRSWLARDVRVDGHPLDPAVLQSLGQWRGFRPAFNALPAALLSTFQPEGDGLGSAENPQAPAIGDLRVNWRELVLPDLAGRMVLRDGRWVEATPGQDADAARIAESGSGAKADATQPRSAWSRQWPWLIVPALALLGFWWRRR